MEELEVRSVEVVSELVEKHEQLDSLIEG